MNVLVTAIGSMSAEAVITSLKGAGHKIVGCDIYPFEWLGNSLLVDEFFQVPKSNNNLDIKTLEKVFKEREIDFVFPLTDPEIDVLSKHIDSFNSGETKICISSEKTIELCRDKKKIHDFFKGSDLIQVIPSFIYDELKDESFDRKILAKPLLGRSSEGIFIFNSYAQLSTASIKKEDYIFQYFLEGSIFTVDYIRDYYGNDFSIPREELLRTVNGAGLTVKILEKNHLQYVVKELGKKLNILGCVNFEFIFASHSFYLMDINPRFSAGIAFSQLSGYDMVKNHLKVFLKKKIEPPVKINERILIKKYVDIFPA